MPRRKIDHIYEWGPEATKRRIIDAAIEVFADKGYHDAAVDDIVRASDTSKGAVYFHFPSKQAIFFVLIDELTKVLAQRIERSIERESGPLAKVEAAMRTVVETFTEHRRLSRILFIETVGAGRISDDKILEIHSRFAQIIQRNLDEAVAQGAIMPIDTEMASHAWFGAINEIVTRWLYSDGSKPLDQTLPNLAALFMRSLGALPSEPERQGSERQKPTES